jgi:N-acetylneuraminic acid mutarotase
VRHVTPYSVQTAHAAPDEVGLIWRQVAVMPEGVARPATATGRDGNIYVFGGAGAAAVSNGTFIYHPRTNTWTEGANLPTPREGAQAITLPDGRIVVIGGEARGTSGCTTDLCQDGTVYNTVEEYTPASNTWRTLAPLMTPRYRFAAAFYRGHIYVFGGVDGREVLSRVEAYDPRTNAWNYAAPLPQPERGPAAAVVPGAVSSSWAGTMAIRKRDSTTTRSSSTGRVGSAARRCRKQARTCPPQWAPTA